MASLAGETNNTSSEAVPLLEIINLMKNIPVIQSAIEKTESTYSSLKNSHNVINWALTQAEIGLQYATASATPIVSPLAKKYEDQINVVDQKLCRGLNIVEEKVPIVKQQPQEIYDTAIAVMNSSFQPTIDKLYDVKESAKQQAFMLKEISVAKANEFLNTQYGNMTVQGVDNTNVVINNLLDRYFPAVKGEEVKPAPVSADENQVLHSLQTVGQLSTKTANRIYHSIVAKLRTMTEEEILLYLKHTISIIQLISGLYFIQKQWRKEKSTE